MAFLTQFDQSGLLAESLALLDYLPIKTSGPWSETWWGHSARPELHDELFRYFLALPGYANQYYTTAPRVALLACTQPASKGVRAPDKQPPLARPVALIEVENARSQLRQLVSLPSIYTAISNSFGSMVADGLMVVGGLSTERPSQMLVSAAGPAINILRTPPPYVIPAPVVGAPLFEYHREIYAAVTFLLEQTLPYGDLGVSLPSAISQLCTLLDSLDAWLIRGLQDDGDLRNTPGNMSLWIWGLSLSLTARAYVADYIASLTRLSLPIHRLYNEWRGGSRSKINLSPKSAKPYSVETKGVYNAFTAIGLLEMLTGKAIEHMDADPGDGYLPHDGGYLPGNGLVSFGDIEAFDRFWKGSANSSHQAIVDTLRSNDKTPFLYFAFTAAKKATTPVSLGSISVADMQDIVRRNALPELTVPSSPQTHPKKPSPNKKASPAKSATAHAASTKSREPAGVERYKVCGHFEAHLRLNVAEQLASLIAAKVSGIDLSKVRKNGEFIRISAGSERWGGNHPPHLEHRDGWTFDITIPSYYPRWNISSIDSPQSSGGAQGKKANKKGTEVILIPLQGTVDIPADQPQYVFPLAQPNAVMHDAGLENALRTITPMLLDGAVVSNESIDKLAGTPVHLDADGKVQDDGLRANLIGHAALLLAGVRKLVYASYYERYFALRAIGTLLNDPTWLATFADDTRQLKDSLQKFEFVWKPTDHFNHWHVVFPGGSNDIADPQAKSQATKAEALRRDLRIWSALGVNVEKFGVQLASRQINNGDLFRSAAQERAAIVDIIDQHLRNAAETPGQDDIDKFLQLLGSEIARSTYAEIPSLSASDLLAWVRQSALARDHSAPPGQIKTPYKRLEPDTDVQIAPQHNSTPATNDEDAGPGASND